MEYEIEKFNPCTEAVEFRKQFNSFEEAWQACDRGDWMLWIAARLKVPLKTLTKAKAYGALTVEHLMKDERIKKACHVALAFAKGKATREELDAASADAAAYAAAAAADADAAAYAAYAAYANRKLTADICRKYLTKSVMSRIQKLL